MCQRMAQGGKERRMTREEAIKELELIAKVTMWNDRREAVEMAIEALQTDLVRCKDCRHRDLFSCPLADNDFQKDDDYCSWGERREP